MTETTSTNEQQTSTTVSNADNAQQPAQGIGAQANAGPGPVNETQQSDVPQNEHQTTSPARMGVSTSMQTPDRADASHAQGGDSRDPNAGKRPARIPMQKGHNLRIPGIILDQENYHYHWFTENPNRPGKIEQALGAYYEHVTDADGKQISRPSGPSVTYLMRLPKEYWDEDLRLKKEQAERTLAQEAGLAPNEYAPTETRAEGGKSAIVSRTESSSAEGPGAESPYS